MSDLGWILSLGFAGLLLLGVPFIFALGITSLVGLMVVDIDVIVLAQRFVSGTQSFSLLAIPFFVLAGDLMTQGGLSRRLVAVADACVRHVQGGLGIVTVLSATFFAAISGSAPATTAAIGSIMIPEMAKRGYTIEFAAALAIAAGIIGPIIPPSIPLVLFALVSDTSIGFLFLGGIIPGLLLGAVQMGLVGFTAKRRGFPVEKRVPLRELPRITWEATPALLMPVILLGCMYSGITTPTEAAAVAAFYALLLSWLLYRSLTLGGVYRSLVASARPTVSISMLIAGALVFNFVITSENIPKTLSAMLATWEMSPYVFLFAVNVLLLVLGCFLEGTTIILVILPVLLPTAQHLGVDMVHFGVMCVINIMIGLVTPPYGLLLFMMNKIANISLREMVVELLPFLYVTLGALALITYVPGFVLWLPRLMGYTG